MFDPLLPILSSMLVTRSIDTVLTLEIRSFYMAVVRGRPLAWKTKTYTNVSMRLKVCLCIISDGSVHHS